MNNKVEAALNAQVNREFFSAYLYLSMSSYADREGLAGFSTWFRLQYQEELMHANKMCDFILERGGTLTLEAIAKPDTEFGKPLALFEAALEHEEYITKHIGECLGVARSENDYGSEVFLQWYVTEQIEEEANAQGIIDQLRLVGDDSNGLLMIDRELANRQPEDEE